MNKAKLRVVLKYEFRRGTSASLTVKEVNHVFGEETADKMTVGRWFGRFRSEDFSLEDRPHGRPKLKVDNEVLKTLVESDPSQTTVQLSRHFGVSPRTITEHLHDLGKVRKLEKWVPHSLGALQKEFRFMAFLCHLIRNKKESISDRIITCDEKWILYNNRKRKRQWLDEGEELQEIPKPELHQKKVMVAVWWSSRGLVHYDSLPPGKTINAGYYCLELETVMKKLAVQQPKLINRLPAWVAPEYPDRFLGGRTHLFLRINLVWRTLEGYRASRSCTIL
ncbi:hypothetical protein RvY_16437 [Ramazzottius varieornatus]|uniref:Mos1 transposase HTH domain-containing protein n=1 Tax=Ramazzottius varieornatus TaxID=947166 RepID=A0A1D1VZR3_RAMVA|nr:hypothetical protein RvY_16437 [Ramazzottius varieornatus]